MRDPLLERILAGEWPLVPYAHEIHGLKSGQVEAREILTRIRRPSGEVSSLWTMFPDTKDNHAKRVEIDMLCLETSFRGLSATPFSQQLQFINLEPLTLESPDFWKRVESWLGNISYPPHQIVLEFTESHSIHDLNELQSYARRLREMGLRIAVDDLGAGVASLSHMARLSPDFIKADKSLVEQCHRRPYQAALLNALAVFAERMRVGYIAEGIETQSELQAIIDADVPWAQGFVFGEPEPLLTPAVAS
jgi:EAL domain-containing protein (putative c-di-GMP-specific phosphodiesterase class I)